MPRVVTIFYRNNFDGGDGWTYYPLNVEIDDRCPQCGGRRGKPRDGLVIVDGERFGVDQWDNPCGHIDTYGAVYAEAKLLATLETES